MSRDPRFSPGESGDTWAYGPDGERYWGRFGAAGLLVWDPARGVLLQHRALWSHFGGTWGLPGGARHQGEPAVDAALREAWEEAAVPADACAVLFETVLDLNYWSYTTVVVRATRSFEAVITDPESLELQWVRLEQVAELPLHPRFAESWPALKRRLLAAF